MKLFLQNKDREIYSMHNEGKIVVAERFIRTLRNKIDKYMTNISKKSTLINQMTQFINTTMHAIVQLKKIMLM